MDVAAAAAAESAVREGSVMVLLVMWVVGGLNCEERSSSWARRRGSCDVMDLVWD